MISTWWLAQTSNQQPPQVMFVARSGLVQPGPHRMLFSSPSAFDIKTCLGRPSANYRMPSQDGLEWDLQLSYCQLHLKIPLVIFRYVMVRARRSWYVTQLNQNWPENCSNFVKRGSLFQMRRNSDHWSKKIYKKISPSIYWISVISFLKSEVIKVKNDKFKIQ